MKKRPITIEDTVLNILLEGSLDTVKATKLISDIERFRNEEVTKIVFDATTLKYIASTGIRAVIFAEKMFDNKPELEMVGANADVKKIFDISGISSFITFK